jgi:hypothetical protein
MSIERMKDLAGLSLNESITANSQKLTEVIAEFSEFLVMKEWRVDNIGNFRKLQFVNFFNNVEPEDESLLMMALRREIDIAVLKAMRNYKKLATAYDEPTEQNEV